MQRLEIESGHRSIHFRAPALAGLMVGLIATAGVAVVPARSFQENLPGVTPIRRLRAMAPARNPAAARPVTAEGFYHNDQVPILIEDMNLLARNMLLPRDRYVVLTGTLPPALKEGSRVAVTGVVVAPNRRRADQKDENIIFRINRVKVLQEGPAPPAARELPGPGGNGRNVAPRRATAADSRYALLIAGGYNPQNNHARYWNDLNWAYHVFHQILELPADNIYVLYADGKGRNEHMPVDESADIVNLAAACKDLDRRMDGDDVLFVMVSDHGGGFVFPQSADEKPELGGGVVDRDNQDPDDQVDEERWQVDVDGNGRISGRVGVRQSVLLWNQIISDAQFTSTLDWVREYKAMGVVLGQCFSGGHHYNLRGEKRVVVSASGPNEFSWARSDRKYDEFLYYFLSGLAGQYPDGSPTGLEERGSTRAIFNWAAEKDEQRETPLFSMGGSSPVTARNNAAQLGALAANFVKSAPKSKATRKQLKPAKRK